MQRRALQAVPRECALERGQQVGCDQTGLLLDPQPGIVASDLLPALQRALAGHGLQRAPLQ